MKSSVDICNNALSYVGSEPIMTLDDESKESRLCRQFYDSCRHALLRVAPWSFALKRAALAKDVQTNKFKLPTNCLYVVRTNTTNYFIISDFIESDEKSLEILYVEDVTDVIQMDVLFRELLAYRIAKEICFNLTADLNLQQVLEQKYDKLEAEAKFRMSSEQREQRIPESPWIIARY